jgi:hypothetical protein
MNNTESMCESATEIRDTIRGLAAEVKLLRLLLSDVIDLDDGERFPRYIRAPGPQVDLAQTSLSEFQRLLERRDLAAYGLVDVVNTVILFWEAQDFEGSLSLLKRARAEFRRADRHITEFRNLHKGEFTRHGDCPAA